LADGHNGKSGNGNGFAKLNTGALTSKQLKLAQLLGNLQDQRTDEEKTIEVGVSRATRCSWKKIPKFQTEIYQAQIRTATPIKALENEALIKSAHIMRTSQDERIVLAAAGNILRHAKEPGNVSVSTNVTVNTPAQELREKPRTELGEILERELSTLNRLKEKVLVGSDPEPGKN
jgi:hypothetical protein